MNRYQQLINIFLKLTIVMVAAMAMLGNLPPFILAPVLALTVLLLIFSYLYKGLVKQRLSVQLLQ